MNAYKYLDVSFWYENKEYKLNPISIEDYDDYVEITTYFRHPNIKRGCIGNLLLNSKKGFDLETYEVVPDQEDCYSDVLLQKVMIESANRDEAVVYKYIFLKD